jgi:serine-type D-Ala-D-Ala carboxypeptidase/endopeptidase (penicillin-binding protein 4)
MSPTFLTPVRVGPENDAVARRLLALLFACLAMLAAVTSARASLGGRLGAALAGAGVDPGRYGAMAVDLRTGRVVFAQNPWLSLVPASNEKLAITFAALETLGPAYRIETDVLGRGRLEGSTWQGDLFLRGRGDPTLTRADLAQLAGQLREAGIVHVTGAIVGDEAFFDARRTAFGWKPEFYANESPPLSALAVDRSNASDPALEATVAFREALRSAGIAAPGRVLLGRSPARSFPLASLLSPPLRDIARYMDTESDNYTAELLLKQLGAVVARVGTGPAGAAVVTGVLAHAGIPVRGIRVVDGSGLSRLDRLTAGGIVSLLQAAFADPLVRPTFLAALAVAGRTGTLEDRLSAPPARGNVLAKTGTTNAASALSGFVKLRYAFAIIQNGNPVPTGAARAAQDRFATILATQ